MPFLNSKVKVALCLIFIVECTASDVSVKTHEDFLFTYFGLSPLLKWLPRDVQYLITKQLLDLLDTDIFEMENPHKLVFFGRNLDDDNHIRMMTFSHDSTLLVFGTETVCRLADLNTQDEIKARITEIYRVSEGTYLQSASFNASDTRLIILADKTDNDWGMNTVSFLTELLFHRHKVVIRTINVPYSTELCAVNYIRKKQIVAASINREIFMLSHKHRFALRCADSQNEKLDRYDRVVSAYFFPLTNHVLFQTSSSSGGSRGFPYRSFVIAGNYESGNYSCFLKCTQSDLSIFSASQRIDCIALQAKAANRGEISVQLYDWAGKLMETITLPGERITHLISPNGEHILFSRSYEGLSEVNNGKNKDWRARNKALLPYLRHVFLWHIPSKRIIAYIKARVSFDLYTTFCFNHDGTLFAHSFLTDERFSQKSNPYDEHMPAILGVWQINKLWKELKALYRDGLLLEHALLILFLKVSLKENASFNTHLSQVAAKLQVQVIELKSSLRNIYDRLEPSLKRYVIMLLGSHVKK